MEEHCGECRSFHLMIAMFILLPFSSFGQLTSTESQLLYRVQRLLEYPPALVGWTNWTNFCSLPASPSLTIVCSENRITEFTVVGNRGSQSLGQRKSSVFTVSSRSLSSAFSIDSLFITLSKLPKLEVLSLVSLGLWGPLPEKIRRFTSLQVLNLSSNFIYGQIPSHISALVSLKSLALGNNLFDGTVPDLANLNALEELDLGRNFLGPKFPSFGNNLISLVMRNNTFRSNIPPQLEYHDKLQRLDLSFNELLGPIPPLLFSLPAIQFLDLAGNELSGALPTNVSCNRGLGFVDISRNLLTGTLPRCIRSNSTNRTVLYSWNCLSGGDTKYQHTHSYCQNEALAAVMPQLPVHKDASKSKLGLMLAIAGGIVVATLAFGFVIWVILRRAVRSKRTKMSAIQKSSQDKAWIQFSPKPVSIAGRTPHAVRLGALGQPPYHVFTLEELEETTNNFDSSNLMGGGSLGQMYKGRVRDGSLVAVRCLKLKQCHAVQSLTQSMEVISKLRHRNLVSILGHCIVLHRDNPSMTDTIFLIFEYISNGTLKGHLAEEQKREMLKWPQRLVTAIGVASGIQFLHTGNAPGIFGNDINIENIVFDDVLTAKISGYKLPIASIIKMTKVRSGKHFHGNHGSIEHSDKEDIYQLGIIILQLITGKLIGSLSELEELKPQLERSLTETPTKLRGMTDQFIRGTFAYESLRTAAEIAIGCLHKDFSRRPSIDDVLWHLQYSVQVQEGWASSENLSTRS